MPPLSGRRVAARHAHPRRHPPLLEPMGAPSEDGQEGSRRGDSNPQPPDYKLLPPRPHACTVVCFRRSARVLVSTGVRARASLAARLAAAVARHRRAEARPQTPGRRSTCSSMRMPAPVGYWGIGRAEASTVGPEPRAHREPSSRAETWRYGSDRAGPHRPLVASASLASASSPRHLLRDTTPLRRSMPSICNRQRRVCWRSAGDMGARRAVAGVRVCAQAATGARGGCCQLGSGSGCPRSHRRDRDQGWVGFGSIRGDRP